MSTEPLFFWLDLETTGLTPDGNVILEWAVAIVDDGPSGTMQVQDVFSSAIAHSQEDLDALDIHSTVMKMHQRNHLWEDVRNATVDTSEAEHVMVQLLDYYFADVRLVPLAGSGVFFDLAFIRHHMPVLAKRLHYRILDTRTLMTAAEIWHPNAGPWTTPETHRAADDIRASVANAAICRKLAGSS